MAIVVIGKNSFLAQNLRDYVGDRPDWMFLTREEALADNGWLPRASAVINFAFSPHMMAQGYIAQEDIDSKIAQLIAAHAHIHYIMISTRKVYPSAVEAMSLCEDMPPAPDTAYGAAKYEVEQKLAQILPPSRLTIIRPSNIFGREVGRKTFMGYAVTRLLSEGRIVYDFNPDVMRDFLGVRKFCEIIAIISAHPRAGIYNAGAGFGIPCRQIAQWLIAARGAGELAVSNNESRDGFWLDMAKTNAAFGLAPYDKLALEQDCRLVLAE